MIKVNAIIRLISPNKTCTALAKPINIRVSTFTFSGVDEVRGDITTVKLHALNDL